jgi:predicted nucleic acid-binding Zn ribbon protein
MSRRAPRPIGELLAAATARLDPATTLGLVQRCWEQAVGERVAASAQPVAERGGELQIACEDAVWAAELELIGPSLVDALNAAIGRPALTRVRVRANAATRLKKR